VASMTADEKQAEQEYNEALAFLDSLQFHKIKLGLAPMRDFLAKAGNPENQLKIIHVAGTNGKGSVSAGLVSVLREAGFRAGLYTSPHLSSPRERFRINNSFISKADFTRLNQKIRAQLAGDMLTYFEFTTALALLWFHEQKVDFAVLETGLGGRIDATNVIHQPLLTIITSISMDHEIYLGDSIEQIASEKAGIIKSGVPIICGNKAEEICSVISAKAEELEAPLFILGRDFDFLPLADNHWDFESTVTGEKFRLDDLHNNKPGLHQAENGSLILTALQLLQQRGIKIQEQEIRRGLLTTAWPGRLEYLELQTQEKSHRFLLDGAHNPAGVASLLDALSSFSFDRLICIWGAMADKNIRDSLNKVAAVADRLILCGIQSERGAKPEAMHAMLDKKKEFRVICISSSEKAMAKAMELATENDLILIAGSLYLIGELRPLLAGELVD